MLDVVAEEDRDYALAASHRQEIRARNAEKALRAASQAAEAADASARCTTDSCIICFSAQPAGDIFAPDSGWTTLQCKHGFCTDCLNQWTSTGSHTCPLCREPIFRTNGANQTQPFSDEESDDDDQDGVVYRSLTAYRHIP